MKTKLTKLTDAELADAKIQAKYTIDDDRIAAEQISRWTRAQTDPTPADEPTVETTPEIVAAETPAVETAVTETAVKFDRRAAYEAIVEANRTDRNETRTARFEAVKRLMEDGKSMPAIAVELGLTYRQVKHSAWYVQHPDVPMPTR